MVANENAATALLSTKIGTGLGFEAAENALIGTGVRIPSVHSDLVLLLADWNRLAG